MHIPTHTIDLAIQLIINTRDFCGDERAAVQEFGAERGFDREAQAKLFRIAKFRANNAWRHWQRRAGVTEKHIW